MKKPSFYEYLVIETDEDGNFVNFLSESELKEMLEERQITDFFEDIPIDLNPNYWSEDKLLILKLDSIIVPQIKHIIDNYSLE